MGLSPTELPAEEEGWRASRACMGLPTALFFGYRSDPDALEVCHSCPVLASCRTWGLLHADDHGVVGGAGAGDRRRWRRRWDVRRDIGPSVEATVGATRYAPLSNVGRRLSP